MTFVNEQGVEFEWWTVLPSDRSALVKRLVSSGIKCEEKSQRFEDYGRGHAHTVWMVPSPQEETLKSFLQREWDVQNESIKKRLENRAPRFAGYIRRG